MFRTAEVHTNGVYLSSLGYAKNGDMFFKLVVTIRKAIRVSCVSSNGNR